MTLPKVVFIGTGGTMSSLGKDSLDILDYSANDSRLHASQIVERIPELKNIAELITVNYNNIISSQVYFPEWQDLVMQCHQLANDIPDLAGIVIGHGTSSLEETAWFLNLTLKIDLPVILTGSQRPINALSSDVGMNLVNAVRVAISPVAHGCGVMVLLNDELHAAREVTKTSTTRLQTFQSPVTGPLGHVDGGNVNIYRRPLRRVAPNTEFYIEELETLPRVDISYAYAGSDGKAVDAFVSAGARGIISAGFAPGITTPAETLALNNAAMHGVVIVQSTRAGSGNVYRGKRLREAGLLVADNLNPQKARLLLALALSVTRETDDILRIFSEY
ncbi:MAG: L-asparaginase [Halomonas sp.]|jgi:L-asparaginase|nr:asparaginase [uncultured Halomonas sp.]PHR03193.1 MAG: L-asparaginase [Halomonas sp.]|tara:strand:+ start:5080 stop:6078 length:999 start_codon:yes stop_codon:yes gene_type:complete